MTFASKFPKSAAILVTLLMALPISPGAWAQSLPDAPRIPGLPLPGPGSHCIDATGIDSPAAMAAANAAAAGNTAYFADKGGRAVICDTSGQPLAAYNVVLSQGKVVVDAYNSTARELQRQADDRTRATFPRGDILRPEVTLLADDFAGNRVGGVGDWKVVTEAGEASLFSVQTVTTANGTRSEYRFGDDDGYVHGAHQWLVSPMMDLGAVNANADLLTSLLAAERIAGGALDVLCYQTKIPSSTNNGGSNDGPSALEQVCGNQPLDLNQIGFLGVVPAEDSHPTDLILAAYRSEINAITASLPIVQRAAGLDLDYRFNFAPSLDGVRFWLYTGERAPDRAMLSDTAKFGAPADTQTCKTDPATSRASLSQAQFEQDGPVGAPGNVDCRRDPKGGVLLGQTYTDSSVTLLSAPIEGMAPTRAFKFDAPRGDGLNAFTGDHPGEGRAHVDLTNFTGKRVWILLEAKTEADTGRGGDYFGDKTQFPRQSGFGFELLRINATGQAYFRDARVEDIGQNLPLAPLGNPFTDSTENVRIVAPTAQAAPIVIHLMNGGTQTENGTLSVTYQVAGDDGTFGNSVGFTDQPIVITNLTRNEVRTITVPWTSVPVAGALYRFSAKLKADDLVAHSNDITSLNTTKETNPSTTPVRVVNSAEFNAAGQDATVATMTVRAYARHALTVLRAHGSGPALDVCAQIVSLVCTTPSYAAKKGETRLLQVAVRNDGSQAEDVTAHLVVNLEGVDHSSAIIGQGDRALPQLEAGETRVVNWTLQPSDPGIYEVSAIFTSPSATVNATREVYVQRSTGLICYDDLSSNRECSPSFTLEQPDFLKKRDLTAAIDTPNGLVVTTRANLTSGAIYVRDPTGTWNLQGVGISNDRLATELKLAPPQKDATFGSIDAMLRGPDGLLYLAGQHGTLLTFDLPSGTLGSIPTNKSQALADYASLAWWNGTLWAVGDTGALYWWNQTAKEMQTSNISYYVSVPNPDGSHTDVLQPFSLPLHALLVAGGRFYAAADAGTIVVNNGMGWKPARMDGPKVPYTTLVTFRGNVFATGANGAIAHTSPGAPGIFSPMTPPLTFGASPISLVFGVPDSAGHADDALWAIDGAGHVAVCSTCDSIAPDWTYPALPLPLVGSQLHIGIPTASAIGPGAATLVGESGFLLNYGHGSTRYANGQDWSSLDTLYAKDGANETKDGGTNKVAFRGNFTTPGITGFSLYRVEFDHSILSAGPGSSGYARIIFGNFPSTGTGSTVSGYTCPAPTGALDDPQSNADTGHLVGYGSGNGGSAIGDACHLNGTRVQLGSLLLQDLVNYTGPTNSSGWEHFTSAPIQAPASGRLFGVEFYKEAALRWAIDDVHVYGYNASTWEGCPGGWCDVLHWDGPGNYTPGTRWAPAFLVNDTVPDTVGGVDVTSQRGTVTTNDDWRSVETPFFGARATPWHITTSGDEPVWVANDELTNPSGPRLRSNVAPRLVSPILDLSNAYAPVVSFRQTYAFRTFSKSDTDAKGVTTTYVSAGDMGWIEVQYLRQGPDECPPPATSATTCGWTQFYKIRPDGGYPNGASLGFDKAKYTTITTPPDTTPLFTNLGKFNLTPARAYWARTALPNEKGIIDGGMHPDTYKTVTISLGRIVCSGQQTPANDDCIPATPKGNGFQRIDLSGHQIRLGFHLATPNFGGSADNYWDSNAVYSNGFVPSVQYHTSYPGEGWYITDLKVKGARDLGIDLKASNLDFRVGYDPYSLGAAAGTGLPTVGPGQRVPINVTIANAGTFDVLGYTGALEIRRVTDPVLKSTELVETIPLAQQPLLEPGERANHTFSWVVPQLEGARYALTFRVIPLGIDRDEDPTDNVLTLGTVASPVAAQSKIQYSVEVRVSPQNASSEIVRAIPIFIRNTGNVPIPTMRITRTITQNDAVVGAPLVFTTVRPIPAGTRVALGAVADIDPANDLFFQAPENAEYKVLLLGEVTGEPPASSSSIISALDTFFFDDIEGGPRGQSFRGSWNFSPDWAAPALGFRSASAYAFGDPLLDRYPENADASATLPTIDIGSARDAKIALYHRYNFEPGFDGGALEASADGGLTWTNLPPSADVLDELPQGVITGTPLSAANPLHPTGNPEDAAYVFSGDSATLPTNVGGWVLSQFDLTRFAPVTKSNVAYDFFRNAQLQGYVGVALNNTTLPAPLRNPAISTDERLELSKDTAQRRYWEIDNLTRDAGPLNGALDSNAIVPPPGTGASLWWSGSASYEDDGKLVVDNQMLNIPVNFTGALGPRSKVTLDWWEWADRVGQVQVHYIRGGTRMPRNDAEGFRDAISYVGASPAQTYRLNVSSPVVVARQGRWLHMQSDLTDIARDANGTQFNVSFIYSPMLSAGPADATVATRAAKFGMMIDDRGFAIAGFHVDIADAGTGRPPTRFLDTATAWSNSTLLACHATYAGWAASNALFLPCYSNPNAQDDVVRYDLGANYVKLVKGNASNGLVGTRWSEVSALPGIPAGWAVVPVTDKDGKGTSSGVATNNLGEVPYAWYTGFPGDIHCRSTSASNLYSNLGIANIPCPVAGSESRLVMPSLDLSRIAGENAFLTFDQRYAFRVIQTGSINYPLASGGVVEAQVYDDAAGTWGPWRQLYTSSDNMAPFPQNADGSPNLEATGGTGQPVNGEKMGIRGGYSMFTVNASPSSSGGDYRYDPPFDPVKPAGRNPAVPIDVQYLYSGTSTTIDGATNGWIPARFDVSNLLGHKVRFGFHVFFSGTSTHNFAVINAPDGRSDVNQGGWWLSNISLTGDVLSGSDVKLRLRAATDGSVDAGHWQVDNIGVFGKRYGRNVELEVDDSTTYSTTRGHNVTIPITIRNLGSSVRHGLAVRGRFALVDATPFSPVMSGFASGGVETSRDQITLVAPPLAPGQSSTVLLNVSFDKSWGSNVNGTLLLQLREFNSASADAYAEITDNEVRGFLEKRVSVHVDDHGALDVLDPSFAPAAAQIHQPITFAVTLKNTGGVALQGILACTAEVVDHHVVTNHETSPKPEINVDRQELSSCGSSTVTLPLGASKQVNFTAVPNVAGIMKFHLDGVFNDGTGDGMPWKPYETSVAVGDAPQALLNDFHSRTDIAANYTRANGASGPVWSYARGHNGAGALVLGAEDNKTSSGYSPGSIYEAITPIADLHNFTTQNAFLTFWHQDRLAQGDGVDVHALVTVDETHGTPATDEISCKLVPVGGYDGSVAQFREPLVGQPQSEQPSPSRNPAFAEMDGGSRAVVPSGSTRGAINYSSQDPSYRGAYSFFTTPNNFEDTWTKAVFDLAHQPLCYRMGYDPAIGPTSDGNKPYVNAGPINLLGHEVRFVIRLYAGNDNQDYSRGVGEGFYMDDLSVGPYNLVARPSASQRGFLIDNVTKTFNVIVQNGGSFADVARVVFDADNSSAPARAIHVDAGSIPLAPGESRVVPVTVTLPRDPSLLPTTYHVAMRVESLLDPTIGVATAIDVTFAPRQLADLSVVATSPGSTVQEGTEVFIPITVENHGLIDSLASRVRVTDQWIEGGGPAVEVPGPTLTLPAIHSYYANPDDSSAIVELHWKPERGSVGTHILTIVADPDHLADEYTLVDNVVRLPVVVSPLLIPDLDIANASALRVRNAVGATVPGAQDSDVTRYEVTAGELVTFELKVANTGRAAATSVDVRATIGSLTLPAKSIAYIPAGGTAVTTFNWLAQKGDYNLTFDVRLVGEDCQKTSDDPEGRLCRAQLSLSNDHFPLNGLTLLTVKGYEIAIDLPTLPANIVPGTDLKLPFNVTNAGNAGEDLSFRIEAPNGVSVTLPREGLYLRAGETYAGIARVHVGDDAVAGAPEAHFIRVLAVSRENPMKVASAQVPLSVQAEYAGSLVSSVAQGAPPTFVVPIVARNEGNSVEPWTIRATLPTGWTSAEALPAKLVVPPHDQATLVLHVRAPTTVAPGPQVIQASATMPNGETRDALISVGVQALRTATATVVPGASKAVEGALAFPVTVQNSGNTQTPFTVVLTGVPAGVTATLSPSRFDLAPGAKTVATLTVRPNATVAPGAYAVSGYANFAGVTPETAEGRANRQTLSVTIERPDLGLSTLDYAPRQGLSAGDRVTVRLPVTNHGTGPVSDLPVHLFVDDVFVAETRIANLGPGEKTEASFNWTALPGAHTLTAVADPYNDTVDPAREDNAVATLVTVAGASATGGLAAERAKVPVPGAAWALVVLVALALVVTPRVGSRRPPK